MSKKFTMLVCAWMLCLSIYAQNIKVQGKVIDDKGAAVPAATISSKNPKKVLVITSNDGTFSIEAPTNEALIISAVGFQQKEVTAQANLTVTLTTDVNTLADVVVTGVGVATSKKRV